MLAAVAAAAVLAAVTLLLRWYESQLPGTRSCTICPLMSQVYMHSCWQQQQKLHLTLFGVLLQCLRCFAGSCSCNVVTESDAAEHKSRVCESLGLAGLTGYYVCSTDALQGC